MENNKVYFTNCSDDELIIIAKCGNKDAFITLYERYKQPIINFAYRILHDKHLAEDVLQETFLYIFKLIPTYNPESKFKALLFKTTRNLSITKLRKIKNVKFTQLDENIIPDTTECEKKDYKSDLKKRVEDAIKDLPVIYREVILLKLEEDLTNEDISQIIGIPLGTVKSRIHNAIELLRKMLKYYLSEFLL